VGDPVVITTVGDADSTTLLLVGKWDGTFELSEGESDIAIVGREEGTDETDMVGSKDSEIGRAVRT